MSRQAMDGRLTRLEARQADHEQTIGVQWPDDLFVSGGEGLTPAEWQARYPHGLLVTVAYVDDWQASDALFQAFAV